MIRLAVHGGIVIRFRVGCRICIRSGRVRNRSFTWIVPKLLVVLVIVPFRWDVVLWRKRSNILALRWLLIILQLVPPRFFRIRIGTRLRHVGLLRKFGKKSRGMSSVRRSVGKKCRNRLLWINGVLRKSRERFLRLLAYLDILRRSTCRLKNLPRKKSRKGVKRGFRLVIRNRRGTPRKYLTWMVLLLRNLCRVLLTFLVVRKMVLWCGTRIVLLWMF